MMESATPFRRRAGLRAIRVLAFIAAIILGIGLLAVFGRALIENGIARDVQHAIDEYRWLTTLIRYLLIAVVIGRWEKIIRFIVGRSKKRYLEEDVERLVGFRWRLLGWLVLFELIRVLYSVTW
ncbi:MAG: hypothetical protein OEW08_12630 [Gammaproteobacteria bacterium]|nr:hypothetical protein [Gammaproteobacteria bacterium]